MRLVLRNLGPELSALSLRDRERAPGGALSCILATGLLSCAAIGDASALPVMIAPMGASAVLLFAVPASPLAQPWSIIGGNLCAALIGVTCAAHVDDVALAG